MSSMFSTRRQRIQSMAARIALPTFAGFSLVQRPACQFRIGNQKGYFSLLTDRGIFEWRRTPRALQSLQRARGGQGVGVLSDFNQACGARR